MHVRHLKSLCCQPMVSGGRLFRCVCSFYRILPTILAARPYSTDVCPWPDHILGCEGRVRSSRFRFTQARIRRSARRVRAIHKGGHGPPRRYDRVRCTRAYSRKGGRIRACFVDRTHHRALREQDCALFGAVRLVSYPQKLSETFEIWLTVLRHSVHLREG